MAINNAIENNLIREGVHRPDSTHLASVAEELIRKPNQNVVFVTLDFKTILIKQDAINKICGFFCSDPLYAIYYT
jgi:hypothetical protein